MIKIYILVHGSCSELGYFDIKVLGCYIDKKEAIEKQKEAREIITPYYNISIYEGYINLHGRSSMNTENIPESIKRGYDVA